MSQREKKLNEKPWITRGIFNFFKTRNRLFKSCYKCLDPSKIEFYKKYRNKLMHIKFLAKRQYYDQVLKRNKSNPRKTGSVIREIIDYKKNLQINFPTSLMNNKQTCITNSEKFLNQMCKYFATFGLNLSKKFTSNQLSNFKISTASSLQSFMLLDIVKREIARAIDNIKTNFAPGLDGISPKFIKMAKVVSVPVLAKLYNKCLKEECFPDNCKLSYLILIPKTAAPKKLGDFRSISLLNMFSKIFEKY